MFGWNEFSPTPWRLILFTMSISAPRLVSLFSCSLVFPFDVFERTPRLVLFNLNADALCSCLMWKMCPADFHCIFFASSIFLYFELLFFVEKHVTLENRCSVALYDWYNFQFAVPMRKTGAATLCFPNSNEFPIWKSL